jgi:Flp pilus assembly protein TadG
MPKSPTTRSKHDDQGVVALELVLIAPFLIALIFTIASFGAFFSKKVEVTSAARDAARQVALKLTPVDQFTGGSDDHIDISVTKSCETSPTDAVVTATLHGGYTFSIPFIPLGTKPITATGTMRCGG